MAEQGLQCIYSLLSLYTFYLALIQRHEPKRLEI